MSRVRSWECYYQQRIVFEVGGAKGIGAYLPPMSSDKALVVTDKGVVGAGLLNDVLEGLGSAGIRSIVFDGVESDPPAAVITRASTRYEDDGIGVIIAVGGGSSIDTAKGIAVAMTNPGTILDYVGFDLVKTTPLPLVAIPTTAGTGSEVTNAAMITDPVSHKKVAVATDRILPLVAILDPLLLRSCPPGTAAGSGLDALSHAIEAYTTTAATPISDGLAAEAIRLIGSSFRAFVSDPENVDAASDMLAASSLACLALIRGGLRLGAIHATAEAMGGFVHIHHGLACGLLMPSVVRYNMFASPAKYARVAGLLGESTYGLGEHEAARQAVVALQKLNDDLPIPKGLGQAGVDMGLIPEMASAALRREYINFNCRKPTLRALEEMYRQAF